MDIGIMLDPQQNSNTLQNKEYGSINRASLANANDVTIN